MNFAVRVQPKLPRMESLIHLELPGLIDLLAEETTHYMKMVSNGATKEEFEQCQLRLKTIQLEIEARKKNSAIASDQKEAS